MGASCTGSYEVPATRPDARSTAPPDAADKSQPRQQASVATQGQTTPDDTDNILTVAGRLSARRLERNAAAASASGWRGPSEGGDDLTHQTSSLARRPADLDAGGLEG